MSEIEIKFVFKPFDRLTLAELYACLRLRNEVFIVEKYAGCFQDADNRDKVAWHLLGYARRKESDEWDEEELACYCRIFTPGVVYSSFSIGRVCVHSRFRRKGVGKRLMEESFVRVQEFVWPGSPGIEIGAQLYLQNFYESLGFSREGDVYLDGDNIEHVHMSRPPGTRAEC